MHGKSAALLYSEGVGNDYSRYIHEIKNVFLCGLDT